MKRAIIYLMVCASLGGAKIFSAATDAQTNSVAIDTAEKRAEIREQLLRYTPIGTPAKEVLKFIHTRLPDIKESAVTLEDHPAEGPSAEASRKRGERVVRLDLSAPGMNPFLSNLSAPMPDESGMAISLFPFGVPIDGAPPLYIQWAFDHDNRLLEIFLDRSLP